MTNDVGGTVPRLLVEEVNATLFPHARLPAGRGNVNSAREPLGACPVRTTITGYKNGFVWGDLRI